MPDLPTVWASRSAPPPGWSLLQRQLMRTMEEAALAFANKYTSPGGIPYYADDVDDLFEVFGNWNQFYALGADRRLLDHQLHAWNGTVRAFGGEHPCQSAQLCASMASRWFTNGMKWVYALC